MTDSINQILYRLQQETASLLYRAGHGRLANAVAFCRNGDRCNHRGACPRCASIRSYSKWQGIEAAITSDLHYVAATIKLPVDPPVSHLREAAQDLSSTVGRIIRRVPGVAGALVTIESIPSLVNGQIDPEHDHLHAHVLVAFDDAPALPVAPTAHVRFDHLETISTDDALRWGSYSLKASVADFERDWHKRLAAPESFPIRLEQLSGLRLAKVSGVFRKPQLAANSIAS